MPPPLPRHGRTSRPGENQPAVSGMFSFRAAHGASTLQCMIYSNNPNYGKCPTRARKSRAPLEPSATSLGSLTRVIPGSTEKFSRCLCAAASKSAREVE
ncbi:hypothetical protein GN956_G26146 [Arapaima gigas]